MIFNPVDPEAQDRVLGHSYDGVFQHTVLVDADSPVLFDADPLLIADLAPLVEPLAAVLYGWELVERDARPATAAVWGGGSTAVLTALVGELRGIRTHLVHRRAGRLSFLTGQGIFGATTLHTGASGLRGIDAAFICLPREAAPGALSEVVSSLAPGGVVDLLGGFAPGDVHGQIPGVDLGAVRRANVCGQPRPGATTRARTGDGAAIGLTGHRGTAPHHLAEAQRLLRAHPDVFGALVTHVLSLEAAAAELQAVAAGSGPSVGPPERIKMVIDLCMPGRSHRPADLTTTVGELKVTG
ncbi:MULTISPECIES: dehydrogenase [unclassified Streptomyces]|uniref:dehydrogenase n=1 Tax=unclassified Streptomyces TaxID=2593676 RepID=UPI000D19DBA3|nr:dehydrogenase [Streptomyces sp. TSRI0281]